MAFYIFTVPVILASLYMILALRAVRKHDQVLYRFCQVRRDTMSLIREHNLALTKDDYFALREIVDATSATIHDYQLCKIYVFNFRKFLAAIRRFKDMELKINRGDLLKHEIVRLRNDFGRALVFSFFTFTPFFKTELALKALTGTLSGLATLGGKYMKAKVSRALEILSWIELEKRALSYN